MKRYLVIYITTEGEPASEIVHAENFAGVYNAFMNRCIEHSEVYSVTSFPHDQTASAGR